MPPPTVVSRYLANLASRPKHTADGMWRDNEVRLYCFLNFNQTIYSYRAKSDWDSWLARVGEALL